METESRFSDKIFASKTLAVRFMLKKFQTGAGGVLCVAYYNNTWMPGPGCCLNDKTTKANSLNIDSY